MEELNNTEKVETRGRPRIAAYDKFCKNALEIVEINYPTLRNRGGSVTVKDQLSPKGGRDTKQKKHKAFVVSTAMTELRATLNESGLSVSAYFKGGETILKISRRR